MAGLGTGAPIVKVYHEKSMILPDVSRVLACLYEKNIEFEANTASYKSLLKLQASSHAPVPFYDGPTFLEDSREICRYIAETYEHCGYPFLFGKDALERASIEQWLHHEEHAFNPPSRALFCHLAFPPEEEDDIEMHKRRLEEVLEVYEQRLSDSEFLAGNKFTLADLVHLPNSHHITASKEFVYLYDSRKNVQRWWNDISTRKSWKQVLKDMDRVEEQRKLEELEKQQWQREHPTTTRRKFRVDSRKHTGLKSQTILVPPPVGIISTSPTAPQAGQPHPDESFPDKAPLSQSKKNNSFTAHRETPPASVQSTPITQKTGTSFTPPTAEKPSRIYGDKSSIRGVSVPSEATETTLPTKPKPTSSKEVTPYTVTITQKTSEFLQKSSQFDGDSDAAVHSKSSARPAKEDPVPYTERQRPADTIYGRSTAGRATDTSPNKLPSTKDHQILQSEQWHAATAGVRNLKGDIPSQDSEQASTRPVSQEPMSVEGQLVQGPEMTPETSHADQRRDVSSLLWQQAADAQGITEDEVSLDHRGAVLPPYAQQHAEEEKMISADRRKTAPLPKRVIDEDNRAIPFQTAYDDTQDTIQGARETASARRRARALDADDTSEGTRTYDSASSRLQPVDASHDAPPSKQATSEDPGTTTPFLIGYQGDPKPRPAVLPQKMDSRRPDVSPPNKLLAEDGYGAISPSQSRHTDDQDSWKQARDTSAARQMMTRDAFEETKMDDSASLEAQALHSRRSPPQKQPPAEDPQIAGSTFQKRYFDDQDSTKQYKYSASRPRQMMSKEVEDRFKETLPDKPTPLSRKEVTKDARTLTPSQEGYPGGQDTSKQLGDPGSIPRRITDQDVRGTFMESKVVDSTLSREQPSDAWEAAVPLPRPEVYDAPSTTLPFQTRDPDAKNNIRHAEDITSVPQQMASQDAKETFEQKKLADPSSPRIQPLNLRKQEAIEDPHGTVSPPKKRYADAKDTTEHPGDTATKPRKMLGQDAQGVSEETKANDSALFGTQPPDTWQAATTPLKQIEAKDAHSVTPPSPTTYLEDISRQPRGTVSTPTQKAAQGAMGVFRESETGEQPSDAWRAAASLPKQEVADAHKRTAPFQKRDTNTEGTTKEAKDISSMEPKIEDQDAKDSFEKTSAVNSASSRHQLLDSWRAASSGIQDPNGSTSRLEERYSGTEDITNEPGDTVFKARKMMVDAQDTFEETKSGDSALFTPEHSETSRAATTPSKKAASEDSPGVTLPLAARYPSEPRGTASTPKQKAAQDGRDVVKESKLSDSTSSRGKPSDDRRAATPLPKQEVDDAPGTTRQFQKRDPEFEDTTKLVKDITFVPSRAQSLGSQRADAPSHKQEPDPRHATSPMKNRHSNTEDTTEQARDVSFKPRQMTGQVDQETKAGDFTLSREQSSDTWHATTTPVEQAATRDGLGVIPPQKQYTSDDTSKQPRGTASTPRRIAAQDANDTFEEPKPADSVASLNAWRLATPPPTQEIKDSPSTSAPFQKLYPYVEDNTKQGGEIASAPRQIAAEDAKHTFEETKVADSASSSAKPTYTYQDALYLSRQAEAQDSWGKGRQSRETISSPKKTVDGDAQETYGQRTVDSASRKQPSDRLQASPPLRHAVAEEVRGSTNRAKVSFIDETIESPDVKDTAAESRGTFEETEGPIPALPRAQSFGSHDTQHTNGASRAMTVDQKKDVSTQFQSDAQDVSHQSNSSPTNQKGLGSSPSEAESGKAAQATTREKIFSTESLRQMLKESESTTPKPKPADSRGRIAMEKTPSILQKDSLVAQDSHDPAQTLPASKKADGSTPKHQPAPGFPLTSHEKLTASAPDREKVGDDHGTEYPIKKDTIDGQKEAPLQSSQDPTSQVQHASEPLQEPAPDVDMSRELSTIDQWRRVSEKLQDTPISGTIGQKPTPISQEASPSYQVNNEMAKRFDEHRLEPADPVGPRPSDDARRALPSFPRTGSAERAGQPEEMQATLDSRATSTPDNKAIPAPRDTDDQEFLSTSDVLRSEASETRPDPATIHGDVHDASLSSTHGSIDERKTRPEQKFALSDQESAHAVKPLSFDEPRKKDTIVPAANQTNARQTIFLQQARPLAPITREVPTSDTQGVIRKIQDVNLDNHPTDDSATPIIPTQEKASHAPQLIPGREDTAPAPGLTPDAQDTVVDNEATKLPSRQTQSLKSSPDSTTTQGYVRPTSGDEHASLLDKGAQSSAPAQEPTHFEPRDSPFTQDNALGNLKKLGTHSTDREAIAFVPRQTSDMGAQSVSTPGEVAPSEKRYTLSDQESVHPTQGTAVAAAEQTKTLPTIIGQQETPGMRAAPTSNTQHATRIIPTQEKASPDVDLDKSVPRREKSSQAGQTFEQPEGPTSYAYGSIDDAKKTTAPSSLTKSSDVALDSTPASGNVLTSGIDTTRRVLPVQGAQTPSAIEAPPPLAAQESVLTEDVHADASDKAKSVGSSASPDPRHAITPGEVALSEQKFTTSDQGSFHSTQLPSSAERRNDDINDSDHSIQPLSSAAPDRDKDSQTTIGQQDISPILGTSKSLSSETYDGSRKVDRDDHRIDESIPNPKQVSHDGKRASGAHEGLTGGMPSAIINEKTTIPPSRQAQTSDSTTDSSPNRSDAAPTRYLTDQVAQQHEETHPQSLMGVHDSISTQDIPNDALGKVTSPSADQEAKSPRVVSASAPDNQHSSAPDQDSAYSTQKFPLNETRKEESTSDKLDQAKASQATVGEQDISPALTKINYPSSQNASEKVSPENPRIDRPIPSQERAPHVEPTFESREGLTPDSHGAVVEEPMVHLTGQTSAPDTQHGMAPGGVSQGEKNFEIADQGSHRYLEPPSSARSRNETDPDAHGAVVDKKTTTPPVSQAHSLEAVSDSTPSLGDQREQETQPPTVSQALTPEDTPYSMSTKKVSADAFGKVEPLKPASEVVPAEQKITPSEPTSSIGSGIPELSPVDDRSVDSISNQEHVPNDRLASEPHEVLPPDVSGTSVNKKAPTPPSQAQRSDERHDQSTTRYLPQQGPQLPATTESPPPLEALSDKFARYIPDDNLDKDKSSKLSSQEVISPAVVPTSALDPQHGTAPVDAVRAEQKFAPADQDLARSGQPSPSADPIKEEITAASDQTKAPQPIIGQQDIVPAPYTEKTPSSDIQHTPRGIQEMIPNDHIDESVTRQEQVSLSGHASELSKGSTTDLQGANIDERIIASPSDQAKISDTVSGLTTTNVHPSSGDQPALRSSPENGVQLPAAIEGVVDTSGKAKSTDRQALVPMVGQGSALDMQRGTAQDRSARSSQPPSSAEIKNNERSISAADKLNDIQTNFGNQIITPAPDAREALEEVQDVSHDKLRASDVQPLIVNQQEVSHAGSAPEERKGPTADVHGVVVDETMKLPSRQTQTSDTGPDSAPVNGGTRPTGGYETDTGSLKSQEAQPPAGNQGPPIEALGGSASAQNATADSLKKIESPRPASTDLEIMAPISPTTAQVARQGTSPGEANPAEQKLAPPDKDSTLSTQPPRPIESRNQVISPAVVPASAPDPQHGTPPVDAVHAEQKFAPSDQDLARSVQKSSSAEPIKEEIIAASDQSKVPEPIIGQKGIIPAPYTEKTPSSDIQHTPTGIQEMSSNDPIAESVPRQEQVSLSGRGSERSEGATTNLHGANIDEKIIASPSGQAEISDTGSGFTETHNDVHPSIGDEPAIRNLPENGVKLPAAIQDVSGDGSGKAKSADQQALVPMVGQGSALDIQRATAQDRSSRSSQPPSSAEPKNNENSISAADQLNGIQTNFGNQIITPALDAKEVLREVQDVSHDELRANELMKPLNVSQEQVSRAGSAPEERKGATADAHGAIGDEMMKLPSSQPEISDTGVGSAPVNADTRPTGGNEPATSSLNSQEAQPPAGNQGPPIKALGGSAFSQNITTDSLKEFESPRPASANEEVMAPTSPAAAQDARQGTSPGEANPAEQQFTPPVKDPTLPTQPPPIESKNQVILPKVVPASALNPQHGTASVDAVGAEQKFAPSDQDLARSGQPSSSAEPIKGDLIAASDQTKAVDPIIGQQDIIPAPYTEKAPSSDTQHTPRGIQEMISNDRIDESVPRQDQVSLSGRASELSEGLTTDLHGSNIDEKIIASPSAQAESSDTGSGSTPVNADARPTGGSEPDTSFLNTQQAESSVGNQGAPIEALGGSASTQNATADSLKKFESPRPASTDQEVMAQTSPATDQDAQQGKTPDKYSTLSTQPPIESRNQVPNIVKAGQINVSQASTGQDGMPSTAILREPSGTDLVQSPHEAPTDSQTDQKTNMTQGDQANTLPNISLSDSQLVGQFDKSAGDGAPSQEILSSQKDLKEMSSAENSKRQQETDQSGTESFKENKEANGTASSHSLETSGDIQLSPPKESTEATEESRNQQRADQAVVQSPQDTKEQVEGTVAQYTTTDELEETKKTNQSNNGTSQEGTLDQPGKEASEVQLLSKNDNVSKSTKDTLSSAQTYNKPVDSSITSEESKQQVQTEGTTQDGEIKAPASKTEQLKESDLQDNSSPNIRQPQEEASDKSKEQNSSSTQNMNGYSRKIDDSTNDTKSDDMEDNPSP